MNSSRSKKHLFFKFGLFVLYILPLFLTFSKVFANPANPLETLQDEFGTYAIYFLLFGLYLSPLRFLFPKISWFAQLTKHRRGIGLTCFFYAFLHLVAYILLNLEWEALRENLTKLFVILGLVAFSIIFILGATSNRFSMKKLGGKNWKRLHRLIYLLIPLLFFHLVVNNKENPYLAYYYFLPIAVLETYRYLRFVFSAKTFFK